MVYLHIGNNKSLRISDIIGIFDADTATKSGISRKFLSDAEKRGDVSTAVEEIPKSFILYRTDSGCRVYFSQMATSTLLKRMNE